MPRGARVEALGTRLALALSESFFPFRDEKKQGEPVATVMAPMPGMSLHWLSEVAPSSEQLIDSMLWQSLLTQCGVAEHCLYTGPWYTQDEINRWQKCQTSGEKYTPTPGDLLRDCPDEPFDGGPPGASRPGGATLSHLGRRFCNRGFDTPDSSTWSSAFKRRYNMYAKLHEFRLFVPFKDARAVLSFQSIYFQRSTPHKFITI